MNRAIVTGSSTKILESYIHLSPNYYQQYEHHLFKHSSENALVSESPQLYLFIKKTKDKLMWA